MRVEGRRRGVLQGGLLGAAAEELREHGSGGVGVGAGVGGAGAFEEEAPPAGPSRAAAAARDWLLLATAVDRVAFLAYCLLFGVLAAVYAV